MVVGGLSDVWRDSVVVVVVCICLRITGFVINKTQP